MNFIKITILIFVAMASTYVFSSYVEINNKWNKNEVVVCWGNNLFDQTSYYNRLKNDREKSRVSKYFSKPYSISAKKSIENIVSAEYSEEKTGIYFTGWKNCSETTAYDAILLTTTKRSKKINFSGFSSIGIGRKNQRSDKPSIIFTGSFYTGKSHLQAKEQLRYLALHEFGHLAGLRHEHATKESNDDLNYEFYYWHWWQPMVGVNATLRYEAFENVVQFHQYDSSSIMNYIYEHLLKVLGTSFTITDDKTIVKVKKYDGYSKYWFEEAIFPYRYDIQDRSLLTIEESNNASAIKVRIGLSQADRHTLKCVYDSEYYSTDICHPDYSLYSL